MLKKFSDISHLIKNYNIPLFFFSLVYYIIIIILSANLNIWEDEMYSLNTSSQGLSHAFNQSIYFELQPPVYFLLLTLWRTLSDSILWARLFSVLTIIISQVLLYQFAKNVSGKKIATIISVLFIINPATVFTLLEIRTYALVILLSLLIALNFYRTYYLEKATIYTRIFMIILAIAGIFSQYFIGFLLFANAVLLFVLKKWKPLKLYILDMIIPLGLTILFIPYVLWGSDVQSSSIPEYHRTFIDFLIEIKSFIGQITFAYFIPTDFIDSKLIQWILRDIILVFIFISINYTKLRNSLQELFPFALISLVIIMFFIVVLLLFGKYVMEYKYTLILFVTLSIFMIFLLKQVKPAYLNFWLILLTFVCISDNIQTYHKLYKVKDFRSIAEYIERNEGKSEPVLVYRNVSAEILDIYYNGINKIYPVPKEMSYDKPFGPEQWEISSQNINDLNDKLRNYTHFYVLIDNSPLRGVKESKVTLLDFLSQNFILEDKKTFEGQIDLFRFSNRIPLNEENNL